jgi:hypothetical protein
MTYAEKSEMRELTATELNEVAGGTPFYGMRCSVNQHEAIGAIVNGLGSIPIAGPILAGIGTAVGWAICH